MWEKSFSSGRTALLVLSDGSVFPGKPIGARASKPVVGELVFNTSMTGYQEALTDPSYAGQVLTFTYPLIGNYGVSSGQAFESEKIHCSAVVVHEACETPVHYASKLSFSGFLEQNGVPGIAGCDTRAIVRKIRGEGVMPAALVHLEEESVPQKLGAVAEETVSQMRGFDYGGVDFVKQVAVKNEVVFEPENFGGSSATIALVDCGCKRGIVRELLRRGNKVVVLPPTASAQKIVSLKPDGLVLSNGPGDPALMQYLVAEVKQLLGKLPVFGICLGHQILGHALGGKTFKLKFGHRGSNHPVQNTENNRVFISAQNHGYAVRDLPPGASEWFVNCNDGTNEGLRAEQLNAMSVQYHPEANPGPYDNQYLFDEFMKML